LRVLQSEGENLNSSPPLLEIALEIKTSATITSFMRIVMVRKVCFSFCTLIANRSLLGLLRVQIIAGYVEVSQAMGLDLGLIHNMPELHVLQAANYNATDLHPLSFHF
jgi:hypothetical protein